MTVGAVIFKKKAVPKEARMKTVEDVITKRSKEKAEETVTDKIRKNKQTLYKVLYRVVRI